MADYIAEINKVTSANKIAGLSPNIKFIIMGELVLADIILASWKLTNYKIPLLLVPYFFIIICLLKRSNIKRTGYTLLKRIFIFTLFVMLFQLLLIRQGDEILTWGFFSIRDISLQKAFILGLNTLNIASIIIWFSQITSIEDIAAALNTHGLNHKATFIILSTLQTIEQLQRQIDTIIISQKSRGITIDGNFLQRIKTFIPILLPAFIAALVKIEPTVMMLDSRSFFTTKQKTFIRQVPKNGYENIFLIIFSSFFLILLIVRCFCAIYI